jgi:superfamily II DNA or RNA helicase
MSSGLSALEINDTYSTNDHTVVEEFLAPALSVSKSYDRAVGYFRSSFYDLVPFAMSDLAKNKGTIRILCSPYLTEEDKQVIKADGKLKKHLVDKAVDREMNTLLNEPEKLHHVEYLATLLRHNILEIQVIYKEAEPGIFHAKVGLISDGENTLSFAGSVNETLAGWHFNEEFVQVHCDWQGEIEKKRVAKHRDYFEQCWTDNLDGWTTTHLSKMTLEKLEKYSLSSVPEAEQKLLEQTHNGEQKQTSFELNPGKQTRTPLHYQRKALTNWCKNQRGIISFATGSGKTFTALLILQWWFKKHPGGCAIVLVPSTLLAKQWKIELEEETYSVLQAGGGTPKSQWSKKLAQHTKTVQGTKRRRVVLAVMDSATTDDFINRVTKGEDTLLIADEVHKIGATNRRRSLEIDAGGRLGLSATPERFGDPEGTDAIFNYFGEKLLPEISIKDAQKDGRLVPYFFEHRLVELEVDEQEKYDKLTQRIIRSSGGDEDGKSEATEQRKLLLIQRARILKSARNKISVGSQILSQKFRAGQRWLIYCDTNEQMQELKAAVLESENHDIEQGRVWEYTSMMKFDKDETIRQFETLGGILFSIECLDEGIDIPSISHALILASSTNPRQHIQRRGRVLRTSNNKPFATIYDVLVQVIRSQTTSVFDHDLDRALDFAQDAQNNGVETTALKKLHRYSVTNGSSPIDEDFEDDGAAITEV